MRPDRRAEASQFRPPSPFLPKEPYQRQRKFAAKAYAPQSTLPSAKNARSKPQTAFARRPNQVESIRGTRESPFVVGDYISSCARRRLAFVSLVYTATAVADCMAFSKKITTIVISLTDSCKNLGTKPYVFNPIIKLLLNV